MTVRVHAAGSLRGPLTAIGTAFGRATGHAAALVFGPSGLLRDRIGNGEASDVFASANMEHPRSLVAQGWSDGAVPFARNELCVLAGEHVPVTSRDVLDVLLDPRWKLGTSTPVADPSGDYAWEVFRRADTVHRGAYALLDAKARKLTGGGRTLPHAVDRSVYAMLVTGGDADVFLTYRTNARQAVAEAPGLTVVELPDALRVGATYGLAVRRGADAGAQAFADHVLSSTGQRTLAAFGFSPP